MNGGNGNDGSRPPANDDDGSLRELERLLEEPPAGFGDRVRRRIERRAFGGTLTALLWHAPAAVLLELLALVFELVLHAEPGEGDTR